MFIHLLNMSCGSAPRPVELLMRGTQMYTCIAVGQAGFLQGENMLMNDGIPRQMCFGV